MEKKFAVIDAGSEDTFALAVRLEKSGRAVVEAFHRARSSGLSDGSVTEVYPAAEHLRSLLEGLSKKAEMSFSEVYAGISSPSVEVLTSSASTLISRYGREVSSRDVRKCVEIGSMSRIPLDREVLHKVVMGFSVDGERFIRDPEGLEAVKLGVEVNIVTIGATVVRNFSKTIAQAGYIPAGFVFSPMGCASRILTEDDKLDRTAFFFVRGKRTEVLLFNAGNLANCSVFDRSVADGSDMGAGETEYDGYGWFFRNVLSMRGWSDMRKIVVSGTKSLPDDFLHSSEKFLGLPIRAGLPLPHPSQELPEDGAQYATVLGILDQMEVSRPKRQTEKNPLKRMVKEIAGVMDEYF
ncbi:MAG TPA: cell division protein FtsA [Candidatus Omnitrophota bacterium]|nr:cell division protein FtsA [Candidatus Omnitrophota bacterium]